jgi:hypothetical protein
VLFYVAHGDAACYFLPYFLTSNKRKRKKKLKVKEEEEEEEEEEEKVKEKRNVLIMSY